MPAGSVLFSSRAPIGYVAIAREPVCTNQGFKSLVPSEAVTSDFLYWFLRHATPAIRATGSGTTFAEVSKKRMQPFPLPLPPRAEQRRIVAAIEEQLSRLDAAEASLDTVRRRLDLVEGAILDGLLASTGAPMAAVSDLSEFVTDGDHNPPKRVPHGIPHLTARNVKRGTLILDGASFVSDEGFQQTRRRYDPREGDVIVTCVGTIGQTAVVPPGFVFSADRNLAAIRPTDEIDPRYLRLVLAAPRTQRRMAVASGSTAQPHLYLRDLRSLTVPKPTIGEQQTSVTRVEEQLSMLNALRSATGRALSRSASLGRAVLEQAFRGELVPQDPNDEPASVLLERIAAERAAAETATGRRPRRRARMQT
jgi:type I restriction enzyme S subunit